MKKSLIALAIAALSGAAYAQSSVTLYGVADVWVGSEKVGDPSSGPVIRQTKMGSGGYNGSRFGFRGTEDLGGGLKAGFVLEQGFNVDDGSAATNGLQFSRQAYLGLDGGFGTVRLGRQYSAYDELRAATNNAYDSTFAPTSRTFGGGVTDYTNRIDNQLYYATPEMNGFRAAIGYGFGEDKTSTASAKDDTSLHVRYAQGPVLVGVAYQKEEVSNTVDRTYTLLAGSYDFGVAKLTAGFNRAKQDQLGKDNEYQFGVSVPVAANAQVAFGYAKAKYKNSAGVKTGDGSGFGITAYYDLSKRTRLYAGYRDTKRENAAGVKIDETKLFAVGVRHNF